MSPIDFTPYHDRLPPSPRVPDADRGRGEMHFRYEDVTQDGRLGVRPTSHAIGTAVWRGVLDQHPVTNRMIAQGILPILTRLVVCAGGGPIGVRARVTAEGGFQLVEAVDARGKSRFRVDMWADVRGVRSRTFGPAPGPEGEEIALGAMWAEHVLTKPFAPAGERNVDELPEGLAVSRSVRASSPTDCLELPEGARWIEPELRDDAAPFALGLGHTDSNQHVNSLVFPQLLEEAALRRLHALGLPFDRFVDRFEMAYRKPSFAGDVLVLRLRAYERTHADGRVAHGVVGVFASSEEHALGLERARVFGTLELAG